MTWLLLCCHKRLLGKHIYERTIFSIIGNKCKLKSIDSDLTVNCACLSPKITQFIKTNMLFGDFNHCQTVISPLTVSSRAVVWMLFAAVNFINESAKILSNDFTTTPPFVVLGNCIQRVAYRTQWSSPGEKTNFSGIFTLNSKSLLLHRTVTWETTYDMTYESPLSA